MIASSLLFVVHAVPLSALATTLLEMSEEELVRSADVIAFAKVRGSSSQWQASVLITVVEVDIAQSLKGTPGASLKLVLPGGIDLERGLAYVVPGVSVPTEGAEMILFARESTLMPGMFEAVGLTQGMLMIQSSTQGARVAVQDLSGMHLQSGHTVRRGERRTESLFARRARIESLLARAS